MAQLQGVVLVAANHLKYLSNYGNMVGRPVRMSRLYYLCERDNTTTTVILTDHTLWIIRIIPVTGAK